MARRGAWCPSLINEELSKLKWSDPPEKWYEAFDAPESEYTMRAMNSEKYRAHRFLNDMDGPGKKCYDGAQEATVQDMPLVGVR